MSFSNSYCCIEIKWEVGNKDFFFVEIKVLFFLNRNVINILGFIV